MKKINKNLKYLGIDWGEKRIGLAIAETSINMALPFKTVKSINDLLIIIKEEEIDKIVVGEPVKMRGEAANNKAWLKFVSDLKQATKIEIELVDERLSSLAADALHGNRKEKAARDEIAASIILQDYLDRNN